MLACRARFNRNTYDYWLLQLSSPKGRHFLYAEKPKMAPNPAGFLQDSRSGPLGSVTATLNARIHPVRVGCVSGLPAELCALVLSSAGDCFEAVEWKHQYWLRLPGW